MARGAPRNALLHLINNVLPFVDNEKVKEALKDAEIDDIYGFLTLTKGDIEALTYKDKENNNALTPLSMNSRNIIKIAQYFATYKADIGEQLKVGDWNKVTVDMFDEFRISSACGQFLNDTYKSSNNTPSPTGPSRTTKDPVADFKRAVKRDLSLYPDLKDERQWDTYNRSVNALARTQDCDKVLDSNYKPSNDQEKALFEEMQKFMYAVFNSTLKTSKGQSIVRNHENDFNAQLVYKELKEHASRSTKAHVDATKLLSWLTSERLVSGSWTDSTYDFVIYWQEQLRLYEKRTEVSMHFHENMKMSLLQNAVQELSELRSVMITAEHDRVASGKKLTYDQYVGLLLAACTNYDASKGRKFRTRSRTQSVYVHELENEYENDIAFNLDTPIDEIQVYAAKQQFSQHKKVSMKRDQWYSLSKSDQETWDKLSEKGKAIILQYTSNNNNKSKFNFTKPSSFPNRNTSINFHEQGIEDGVVHDDTNEDSDGYEDAIEDNDLVTQEDNSPLLVHMAEKAKKLHPAQMNRFLSSSMNNKPNDASNSSNAKKKPPFKNNNSNVSSNEIVLNGNTYRQVNAHKLYHVSNRERATKGSLVDRGSNGGVGGADVRVIAYNNDGRLVDVTGVDDHRLQDIRLATVGGVAPTQHGDVIVIMHEYAYLGKGKTIHSSGQLEWYKNKVYDQSQKTGGRQCISTIDGYVFPLDIKDGLPYLPLRPYTDKEYQELPMVILTADGEWDPKVLDNTISDTDNWFDAVSDLEQTLDDDRFDLQGNYRHHALIQSTELHYFDAYEDLPRNSDFVDNITLSRVTINEHELKVKNQDYEPLRPFFAFAPLDVVKATIANTTQYARLPASTHLKNHYRSPFPALNVPRRSEPVATDIVYSDTPAVDNGSTCAAIFVGTDTLVTDVYGLKTEKQFTKAFEDNIRQRGAPSKLISDGGRAETSNKIKDILRALFIADWQSEPYQHQQNYAERRYQTLKTYTNRLLDRVGAPPYCWLLALSYVCFLLNVMAIPSRNNMVPMTALTGRPTDCSAALCFTFWDPVYFKVDDNPFPSTSREEIGRFVGIAENVGHQMTFRVLNLSTMKVIPRSNIRLATENDANLRVVLPVGEETRPPIIKSLQDMIEDSNSSQNTSKFGMQIFEPESLIGKTFLLEPKEDGTRHRATILQCIDKFDSNLSHNEERIKFLCSINNDEYEEIMSYNDIISCLQTDSSDDRIWKFKDIVAHEGPLLPHHPNYKGSNYNVCIEWENGEVTWEPLGVIAKDDPVTCAIYADKNKLLEENGWKRFKSMAKRQKKLLRLANQSKLRSFRITPRYKYGYQVPRNYEEAMELDKRFGNTRWKDAVNLEMESMETYKVFKDCGTDIKTPEGYKRIRVHIIFDVKHDGRHKARLVAGGHLTDVPLDSVYSGVVSLRGLRLMIFLAELNGLETWATDIGNAYLEAKTKEKVCIVAGPEFGELQGHLLLIEKALYGLRSSGLRWHERFADCLRDMGFFPCKAEPDIWIRRNGSFYEYLCVYVDDIAFACKDPKQLVKMLTDKYHFKLKGTGPISFHLGCDFFRDEDGTLCMAPKKYIERMINAYERMFGNKPSEKVRSPLEKGDHPEIDLTELLDNDGVQKYQSLIGALQWAVSIGRFDITTATMTMSGFRVAPKQGHMDRVKRIYSYLSKFKDAIIRFRVDEPDFSSLPEQDFDWDKSVYGDVKENIPDDAPEPLGKYVTLSHFLDANLYHDIITGRSVTGILHFVNQTPIDWFSKKQATVETATYASEFIASRTCVEQVIDLRTTLRYLGVPIREKSYMFGDNKSVVDSATFPHSKLHKRHTALSFHRVREAIASKYIAFFHIPGEDNPADVLSKHWSYNQVWKLLQPLLFWKGDTINADGVFM